MTKAPPQVKIKETRTKNLSPFFLERETLFQFSFLEVGKDLHPIWIEFCFSATLFLLIISPTHIFLIIYFIPWHHFFPPDIIIILFSLAHCYGHTFSLPDTGITITHWFSTKQLWKRQKIYNIQLSMEYLIMCQFFIDIYRDSSLRLDAMTFVCSLYYLLLCCFPIPYVSQGKWKSLSHVWLFAIPWTIQSKEFSKTE